MRTFVARWLAIAGLVAGCSAVAVAPQEASPGPPRPCAEVYGTQRCLAMTDVAAAEVGRTRDDVSMVEIVPDPPPRGAILGGAWYIRVRTTFADGSAHDAKMCGGIPGGPACMDEPRLEAVSGFSDGSGYKDVPCPDGASPNTCGQPLPSFEASALAAARPLSMAKSLIPIDHVGDYEVSLGKASIPNGVVSAASFGFVDTWPSNVSLDGGAAGIELRSLEPDGKAFQNYYDHGWRPGAERVEALLVFRVLWFEKGAALAIRDIEVH